MISQIEIIFGAPVELPAEMQHRLVEFVEQVCDKYETAHPDRVMWAAGIGDRPSGIWGGDEPSFDSSVFQIDCCERERFEGERQKKAAPPPPEDAVEVDRATDYALRSALMRSTTPAPSPREKALEETLRPFAEAAARIRADDPDNDRPCLATVANYRAARALLDTKEGG